MKLGKNIALIGIGMGATLAYQKYSKPMMKAIKKKFNKVAKEVDTKLDDMM
ncbi:MAG: hypothetical protein NC181_03220 [Clostridium sp.]|nr:hypothetical protein [Clostridium sp.]MCM1444301.1 hypothetical protein [Candidatus Amulumruptor caecigallinarius]